MEKSRRHSHANDDIVVSSRVRLARNLSNINFETRMTEEDAKNLMESVERHVPTLSDKEGQSFNTFHVNRLSELDRTAMVEWHIISPMLANKSMITGLVLSRDESVGIMVNEEDHLRIQCVVSGMNITKAMEKADRVDDILGEVLPFAFHEQYGYLTTCPTNTGTGLRASYMLFLPALSMEGKIQPLLEELGKFGIAIRGIYGEGSKSLGHMYQVSNQKTLGSSESDIIRGLNEIVTQIIKQERKRREYLLSTNETELSDKVYRSYGILKYAKQLSGSDAMMLLSQVKLGVDTGLMELKKKMDFHKLMMEIQPASLQKKYERSIGGGERDGYRASYINVMLPDIVK